MKGERVGRRSLDAVFAALRAGELGGDEQLDLGLGLVPRLLHQAVGVVVVHELGELRDARHVQLPVREQLEHLGHPPRRAHHGDAPARLILGQPEPLDAEPKQRAEAALDVELAPLDLRHEPERL
ncbi:MAG: hypothetical protein RIT81_34190, partial [Deltaproteobacteria bacterium]